MKRALSRLYDKTMSWAGHRHAPRYLAGLSFAESSFFPIPPDVMLAPMALRRPDRAWRYAALATVASALGGVLGYFIGMFAYDLIQPFLHQRGYGPAFERVHEWFGRWGFWAVFLAGFTPVPYKIFTITAGVVVMPLAPFFIASLFGRGARFFLVAGLMVWGGERMERTLREYIDRVGWVVIVVAVAMFFILRS